MHSIHLTFSDLKGTHTHRPIGKRHMHSMNLLFVKKKKEREVLH